MNLLQRRFSGNPLVESHKHKCAQLVRLETWPYTIKCHRKAVGLASTEVREQFILADPAICIYHLREIKNYLDNQRLPHL